MNICTILVENLIKKSFKKTNDKSINGVDTVYKVEGCFDVIYFWNSSNNESIADVNALLDEIHLQANGGILEGSVNDNMNEIMFEVEEV